MLLSKFIFVATGYAGVDSRSQIPNNLPVPAQLIEYLKYQKGSKRLPPSRSSTPETRIPDASSTTMYFPPGLTLAALSIWESESGRMSRSLFWSLLNQYSLTLKSVGSMVEKDLEYLSCVENDFARKASGTFTWLPCVFCIFPCCTLSSASNLRVARFVFL